MMLTKADLGGRKQGWGLKVGVGVAIGVAVEVEVGQWHLDRGAEEENSLINLKPV